MAFTVIRKTVILVILSVILSLAITWVFFYPHTYIDFYGQAYMTKGIQSMGGIIIDAESYRAVYWSATIKAICIAIAFMLIIELYSRRIHSNIVNILYKDCNPQKFLKTYSSIIKKINKPFTKRYSRTAFFISAHLIYAKGLFESGDIRAAINELVELTHNKGLEIPQNIRLKVRVYLALLQCHYLENETDNAAHCMVQISLATEKHINGPHKLIGKNLPIFMLEANAISKVFQGNHSDALEYFQIALQWSENDLESVHMHCYLAIIYAALNDVGNMEYHINQAQRINPSLFSVVFTQRRLGCL